MLLVSDFLFIINFLGQLDIALRISHSQKNHYLLIFPKVFFKLGNNFCSYSANFTAVGKVFSKKQSALAFL
jgi:hypothetical protein